MTRPSFSLSACLKAHLRSAAVVSLILPLMLTGGAAQAQSPGFGNVMAPDHPLLGRPLPGKAPAGLRPTRNLYGVTGLIDMPTAQSQPDGELGISLTNFGGNTRATLAFQISPRLSGAFRYAAFRNWNSNGFQTYYDRSFDLKYQILQERRWTPAVAIGLQDFAGTGVSAAEYIVATKTLAPGLTVTGGLGWGRLASNNPLGNPTGTIRPGFDPTNLGGQFSVDQWFRGEAAPFGGVEWRPTGPAWGRLAGRVGFKLEYSSDVYVQEAVVRDVIDRSSSVNFGAEYQISDTTRIGLYSLYGEEVGLNFNITLNPRRPAAPVQLPPTGAFPQRPDRSALPAAWGTDWAAAPGLVDTLREQLAADLAAEGQTLVASRIGLDRAEVRIENIRHRSNATAVGRTARAMAARLPSSVETFDIVLVETGLPVSRVTLRRSDLESLDAAPNRVAELRAVAGIGAAAPTAPGDLTPGLYPRFDWSLSPYLTGSYFDPQDPVRLEVGLRARASYQITPGLQLAGSLTHRLAGNTDEARPSTSGLANVRSLGPLYDRATDTRIETLTLSYDTKLSDNVYGRVSAGLFETMYGGIAAEVLWKPVSSRLALGAEIAYVRQRDFDGGLDFRRYDIVTGHASAYYDFENGYTAQLDAGRYLAGDVGATLSFNRTFENGWQVGAFATLTSASAAEFGEGSFDKGITLNVPLDWVLGRPSTTVTNTTVRPIQRDGGARVGIPGRLYERVRESHAARLEDEWAQVWQ